MQDLAICRMCDGDGGCCTCSYCDCCCCKTYHSQYDGECGDICRACNNTCGGICDCCGCDSCDGCDGGGEGVLIICVVIVAIIIAIVVFLLPVIVFSCIAAPFWVLAQYVVWKFNDKVPWIIVVLIFILFLIPPCIIWAYLWTFICFGNITNGMMTVLCLIWSFFHTVYSNVF